MDAWLILGLVSLDKCMEILYWWFYGYSCCSSWRTDELNPIPKHCAIYSTRWCAPWSTTHVCVCVCVLCCPVLHPLLMMVKSCWIPLWLWLGLDPFLPRLITCNFHSFYCQVSLTLVTGQILLFAPILHVSKIYQALENDKIKNRWRL